MSGDDQARKRPVRDDSPGPSKKWRHSRDDDSPADEDTLDLGHRINENAAEAGPAGSQLPAVVVTTHDSATEHNEHDDEVIAQDPHDVNRPSTSGMSRSSEGGTNPGGDTRTPAETTKKPYRLKIKLPDCEPGPSGLQFPRPKSRTGDAQRSESEASTSGFLPPFIFDRNRPFKDRSELAKTAPYSLGRGYSNYFELNALEDMVKESKVFLTDAATVRSIADAEENLLTRVMGYLRAIAVYIVAADTLESVENHPRRALETYQQARALVTDANQLLTATPESRTRTRLSIFYLRVESWLESRMCRLRKILAAEEMFMAQQATFCRVVRRLRTLALADVPPTKTVPTEITLQQRNNVLESMALQGAFDSWFLSVRRISDSRDDAFFLAVECALLKYISMLCEPRLFVEYIREFVSRIERFKDQEG